MSNSSIELSDFKRFAHSLTYVAIPHSTEIEINGLAKYGPNRSDTYSIQQEIDRIASDALLTGEGKYAMLLLNGNGKLPEFVIAPDGWTIEKPETLLSSKEDTVKSCDIGIKGISLKKLRKRLSHSPLPLDDIDYIRHSRISAAILNKSAAAAAIPWTCSNLTEFSNPCILLNSYEQLVFAIKVCKLIENKCNAFLKESGFEASISIPCRSLSELEKARAQFLVGEIKSEEFSDIVFNKKQKCNKPTDSGPPGR